jgi:hypothetical protein
MNINLKRLNHGRNARYKLGDGKFAAKLQQPAFCALRVVLLERNCPEDERIHRMPGVSQFQCFFDPLGDK